MLSFSPPFAHLSINSSSHCWVPGAIRWYLPHQGVFTTQDPWGPAKDHANGSSVGIGWHFRCFLIAGTFWGGGGQWRIYRCRASGKRGWARGWAEQLGGAQKRWRFTGHQQMRLTGKWMAWRPDVSPQHLHDLHLLSCLCYPKDIERKSKSQICMYMEQMRGDASKHFGVLKLLSILRDVELWKLYIQTLAYINTDSWIYTLEFTALS